jgi:hypothetical protein
MELKTYEEGVLIKIGKETWERETRRQLGLGPEEIEESMYSYYFCKKEIKKQLDQMKIEGYPSEDFKYYPCLVRDVLSLTPDGAAYKRRVEELMNMIRAHLTEKEVEVLNELKETNVDAIRVVMVNESEVKKKEIKVKEEKKETNKGTYATLPKEEMKTSVKEPEKDTDSKMDVSDYGDMDDEENEEGEEDKDNKRSYELGWNREEKVKPRTREEINKGDEGGTEFFDKKLIKTERTAVEKKVKVPLDIQLLSHESRPKIDSYNEAALEKPKLHEKDLKVSLKDKESMKKLIHELAHYWNQGGQYLPLTHVDSKGLILLTEKFNIDIKNFSSMGYVELIDILIRDAYKDYEDMEPLAVRKLIEGRLMEGMIFKGWKSNPLAETNFDNWLEVKVKIMDIMQQWNEERMPKEIKDLFIKGFRVRISGKWVTICHEYTAASADDYIPRVFYDY